jgi:hypothetical protein
MTTHADMTDSVLAGVAKALLDARTSKAKNEEIKENAEPEPGLVAALVVPSTTRHREGHVIRFYEDGTRKCSCEGFTFRGYCKHTTALLDPNIMQVVRTALWNLEGVVSMPRLVRLLMVTVLLTLILSWVVACSTTSGPNPTGCHADSLWVYDNDHDDSLKVKTCYCVSYSWDKTPKHCSP